MGKGTKTSSPIFVEAPALRRAIQIVLEMSISSTSGWTMWDALTVTCASYNRKKILSS